MPKTVNATPCDRKTFVFHKGEAFEIVRFFDGNTYVNRNFEGMPLRTPQIPEFTTYGEIRIAYQKTYGIILPEAKDLKFIPSGTHKQCAYAII